MNYKSLLTNRYFNPCRYGVNVVGFGTARDMSVLSQMQFMGCTTMRFGVDWSQAEPTQGTIFWSGTDGIVAICKQAGILPIFSIFNFPSWANGGLASNAPPTYNSANDIACQGYYAGFIASAVTRYGTQCIYELGNEPNTNYVGSFWSENGSSTTLPKWQQYYQYYSQGRAAGRAVNPNAIFSVAGMAALSEWGDASGTPGITYLQSLMGNGIVADQFSGHAYTSGGVYDPSVDSYPTGNSFKDIARLQAAMISGGYGKMPLRIGEFGNYSAATAGSEAIKAGYVTAAYQLVESTYSVRVVGPGAAGVVNVCYFSLNNGTNGTSDTTDTGLWTGTPLVGPNTILASGTALRTFLTGMRPTSAPFLVTVSPSSFSVTVSATQTLTATVKDQYGNVLTGQTVTWTSSDVTKATVNSSTGVVTGVASGSVTITATCQTATGTSTGAVNASATFDPSNTTTGAGILSTSSSAVPVWADWPSRYANDTAFRAAIANSINTYATPGLAGTYSGSNVWVPATRAGARYGDGRYVDLQAWVATPDAAYGPGFSEACFEAILPGINTAAPTPTPELYPYVASGTGINSLVMIRRMANCSTPKFTGVGDGNAGFNAGANASWKSGMFAGFNSGRAGQETANYTTTGGNPVGNIALLFGNAGTTGGFTENYFGGNTDTTWTSGSPRWEALVLEQWTRISDSTTWCANTRWIKTSDAGAWVQSSPRMVAPIGRIDAPIEYGLNSNDNYNQSRATSLKLWYLQSAVWNFDNPNSDGSNDPAGFLATKASGVPSTSLAISVTSSSSSAVTCNVQVSIGMAAVRLKIDSTMITGQDYVLKREDGEAIPITGGGNATANTVSVPVTGLSLAAGSHTVRAYAVNAAGTQLDPTGVATTFTV